MVTIDRIISALALASPRDANLAALDHIVPASPRGNDAMAAKLEALIRAIASWQVLGATEDLRRASSADMATQTASTTSEPSESAAAAGAFRDARMARADAPAVPGQFLHMQLEACEVSFESVRGVLCDCISQLDRPSSLSTVIRAA